jgi:ribosome biogenesis GTPase A
MSKSMTDAQKKLIGFCSELENAAKEIELSEFSGNIAKVSADVQKQEIMVPVIGVFSAGKSTLINNIIGKDILPAAITPETSLAMELRYCDKDYIEAVKADGSVKTYSINEINILKNKAADYMFGRLYLNNASLKAIQPLVLVDMPGFDSPLDQHNKAIDEYLGKRGCHYIVLISAEDGTLFKSLIGKLKLIQGYGATFSFFLSKANLRTESNVNEIIEHLRSALEDNLDIKINIRPLGKANGHEILQILKNIDINSIYFNLYQPQINDICQKLISGINARIKAIGIKIEDAQDLICKYQENILKIHKKTEDITTIIPQYSSEMIAAIVYKDIANALDNSVNELVSMVESGDQEGAVNRIDEIVHETFLLSLKRNFADLSQNISAEFALAVPNINASSSSSAESAAPFIISVVDIIGTFIGGAHPVMGVVSKIVVVFFANFFGKDENENSENLRNEFKEKIFPDVLGKLADTLPATLDKSITEMVDKLRDEYYEKIDIELKQVEEVIKEKQDNVDNAYDEKEECEALRAKIEKIEGALNG